MLLFGKPVLNNWCCWVFLGLSGSVLVHHILHGVPSSGSTCHLYTRGSERSSFLGSFQSILVGETRLCVAFVLPVLPQLNTKARLALSIIIEPAPRSLLFSLCLSCSRVQSQTRPTNSTKQTSGSLTLEFSIFL